MWFQGLHRNAIVMPVREPSAPVALILEIAYGQFRMNAAFMPRGRSYRLRIAGDSRAGYRIRPVDHAAECLQGRWVVDGHSFIGFDNVAATMRRHQLAQ
ncbi:Uncharacterized protein PBTT_03080 [Plasmodiophora brassicae]|uniref:Uncharacterized protein n=1 Tax=Plasmodiophora brassicae TaxID=37360 RepID=A0A0G4J7A6_PLABS|nr:hypothetical protein PBRA_002999 [Plasmodiophora brassicae]